MPRSKEAVGNDDAEYLLAAMREFVESVSAVTIRGLKVVEVAARYRVGPDRVRTWIRSGILGAINTASVQCGKPRFIVLAHHLVAFERAREVVVVPKPRRQERRSQVDYFPD